MKLRQFLKNKKLAVADFAALCECHRGHVHRIMKGNYSPGPRLVRKIETITNGEVTRYDLLGNNKEAIDKV